jgi:4a-hydroxytetrahydrobiopterin dehydratase
MRPQVLSDDDIVAKLTEVPDWSRHGVEIRRSIAYPSFLIAVDAVGQIAVAAEELDHHPDIDIRWRTLHFTLTTHDCGGLTHLDFDLASRIDEISMSLGAVGA